MSGLAWLVLAGCGGVEGERGACAEEAAGRFDVLEASGAATLDGRVYDGLPPGLRATVSVHGACELLVRPTCTDPCAADETCGIDGECTSFPRTVAVGELRLAGAGADLRVSPTEPGATYFAPLSDLVAGESIQLRVGDATLAAAVVESLDVLTADWRLPGAVDLQWTPSSRAGSTIEVRVAVDQHGASQGELRCRFDDTGTATLPSEAVEALLAVGVSGFASGSVRRQRVDHAVVDGRCLEFASTSVQLASVEVDP